MISLKDVSKEELEGCSVALNLKHYGKPEINNILKDQKYYEDLAQMVEASRAEFDSIHDVIRILSI